MMNQQICIKTNVYIYDSEEDDDWWNELCMRESEQFVVLEGKDMADFEDLLNWVDNEFDLEVFQNGEWCTYLLLLLQLISLPR